MPRTLRLAARAPGARLEDTVARRVVRADTVYRSADGFALRIDPADRFQRLMLLGRYDPTVVALARRFGRPGATVVDAGAHLGYLALHFARAVGPQGAVHAFEPDPRLAGRAREHARLNSCARIRVHAAALSDRPAESVTFHLTGQLGWSSLDGGYWETLATVRVPATTLDAHLAESGVEPASLCFVKVDVEGAEADLLRGAVRTLAATEAPVLLEISPDRLRAVGRDPDEIFDAMDELGYRPHVPRVTGFGDVALAPGRVPSEGEDVLFLKP